EEDPVDYPADGGDDGDDEEESSDDDEDDEDDDMDVEADEEEEEEHPAPADSAVRLDITFGPRYEIGESSSAAAARPAGGFRADYGFVTTVDREIM
nr:hypothetical protein [Tanacetum cinerariifolium]